MQINERINLREVRVIGPESELIGFMSSKKALEIAYEQGLDLVLIAPQATPPVCRVMDYGKYRFEKEKREKEARKKQQVVEVKEIQLSCRIDNHDFETKLNHAKRFLSEGNKVRVVLRFKGREMAHTDLGLQMMMRFKDACEELGTVDRRPSLDGRFMSMIVNPIKTK